MPLSLSAVARKLRRSATGAYKVLKQESCPIRANKRVDVLSKHEIERQFYQCGLSSPAIARQLGISKTTVRYWIEKLDCPISPAIRQAAGLNVVKVDSDDLDLLPFVNPSSLRWADENSIVMRKGNSRLAVVSRHVNAISFFRFAGFYLAEGNKSFTRANISNTNAPLLSYYRQMVLSFVRSEVNILDIPARGKRTAKQILDIGGNCLKSFVLNAIDGILAFLGKAVKVNGKEAILGLSFLNGCSDGDGSVARSRQNKSPKQRMQLRLSEGKEAYAIKLQRVLRRILGVGYLYKPGQRNYYEVIVSLSPQRAALLLFHGFFAYHPGSRQRLAMKVLDSSYLRRYVLLYSMFKDRPFSRHDIAKLPAISHSGFIGRSTTEGRLIPVGVTTSSRGPPHWRRLYEVSKDILILAKTILESAGEHAISEAAS
jgi:DNA-binding transcriptional regulator YiaG